MFPNAVNISLFNWSAASVSVVCGSQWISVCVRGTEPSDTAHAAKQFICSLTCYTRRYIASSTVRLTNHTKRDLFRTRYFAFRLDGRLLLSQVMRQRHDESVLLSATENSLFSLPFLIDISVIKSIFKMTVLEKLTLEARFSLSLTTISWGGTCQRCLHIVLRD